MPESQPRYNFYFNGKTVLNYTFLVKPCNFFEKRSIRTAVAITAMLHSLLANGRGQCISVHIGIELDVGNSF